MKPETAETAVELLHLGFGVDEVQEFIESSSRWNADAMAIREELLAIQESLEEIYVAKSKPTNAYVEYKSGWYQDVNGNLYQYDGIVWDVVPGKESGELEFLG